MANLPQLQSKHLRCLSRVKASSRETIEIATSKSNGQSEKPAGARRCHCRCHWERPNHPFAFDRLNHLEPKSKIYYNKSKISENMQTANSFETTARHSCTVKIDQNSQPEVPLAFAGCNETLPGLAKRSALCQRSDQHNDTSTRTLTHHRMPCSPWGSRTSIMCKLLQSVAATIKSHIFQKMAIRSRVRLFQPCKKTQKYLQSGCPGDWTSPCLN